jgi:hypothetical protein
MAELARYFPVVTVTGPRQSGKTTLCRAVFPAHRYVSLEAPDTRALARSDPRGFLESLRAGAILDEVQRAPDLLSYLQVEVDREARPGRFVLTGSANLALLESVTQSLAGRTGLLELLPCSLAEVRRFPEPPAALWETVLAGGYPAVFDRGIPPGEWFRSYVATYVERDLRQLLQVGDLEAFQRFLQLCAGRVGQLVNLSALGADCGITHNTARAWLSVLEASYIAYRVPPLFASVTTRLVKTPKLYLHDTGLACWLLGIATPEQLRDHPLRGPLFENWVAAEIVRQRAHSGRPRGLSFYRDRKGFEIDLLVDDATAPLAVEVKSGQTVATDFFAALDAAPERLRGVSARTGVRSVLVYGGDEEHRRHGVRVLPWHRLDTILS